MEIQVKQVDVWSACLNDQPGALAGTLRALAAAKACPEFIMAQRNGEDSGTGEVYLAPIAASAQAAAGKAGLCRTQDLCGVRLEAQGAPDLAARAAAAMGQAGINIAGACCTNTNNRCIVLLTLDSAENAAKAVQIFKSTQFASAPCA